MTKQRIDVKHTVRTISRGGMGVVDEVELVDGTRVARKTFSPDPQAYTGPAELEKLHKRFEREVRYQSELGRTGAMPVIAFELAQSPPWFLMPLAEMTYAQRIVEDRRSNKISPEPLADILSGLEQIHALDYVHRDLKPENVLYWQGRWCLSDFGLAANISSSETSRFTTFSAWGTQGYMAPEQLNDFKHVTAAADIYAFGCILHELIEGTPRVPYAVQSVKGPYDFIVRKCTHRDPNRRFKTIAALRAVLFDELRKDPSLVRSPTTDQWAVELPSIATWGDQRADEFRAHIEGAEPGDSIHIIADLREQHFEAFALRTDIDWNAICTAYCDWARASFTFSFCDVIAGCLRAISTHPRSSISARANAAVAMAVLGERNNRWYCMQLLSPMTDRSIVDLLARRIATEIRANELQKEFEHCAREARGWDRSDYHAEILAALDG